MDSNIVIEDFIIALELLFSSLCKTDNLNKAVKSVLKHSNLIQNHKLGKVLLGDICILQKKIEQAIVFYSDSLQMSSENINFFDQNRYLNHPKSMLLEAKQGRFN